MFDQPKVIFLVGVSNPYKLILHPNTHSPSSPPRSIIFPFPIQPKFVSFNYNPCDFLS